MSIASPNVTAPVAMDDLKETRRVVPPGEDATASLVGNFGVLNADLNAPPPFAGTFGLRIARGFLRVEGEF